MAGGPVQQWPGNRIGWSSAGDGAIVQYRYDAFGNRVQAQHADGRTLRLQYDALHQLTAVFEQAPGEKGFTPIARYRYDAFGRRLGKTVVRRGQGRESGTERGTEDTTHYGWDADRLVHTEDSQGLRHTVYEPGNFVPLLQLQRRQGAKDAVQLLMDLGAEPGEDTTDAANSFAAMPRAQREMVRAALQSVLEPVTGEKALQRAQAHMPQELAQLMAGSVGRLQAERQAQAKANPLTIRHYLCDHLGTPIGLVDGNGEKAGQVTWAASYGAWGEVQEEYNPQRIEQNIRFQGQQLDVETGLHYNRFRYYDPTIGQYVSQDPIGLNGGINKSSYPINPMNWVDPMGLDPMSGPKGPDIGHAKGWYDKIKDMLDFKENIEEGRKIRSDKNKLMCQAEKELNEKIENNQITPEAAKAALAAKEVATNAAGPVSEVFQIVVEKDFISGTAKAYGFISEGGKNCAAVLTPNSSVPVVDFFKK